MRNEQFLLRLFRPGMDEDRRFAFREVIQPRVINRTGIGPDGPADALRLFLDGAMNWQNVAILIRRVSANRSVLIHGDLKRACRCFAVAFDESKNAQREPISAVASDAVDDVVAARLLASW